MRFGEIRDSVIILDSGSRFGFGHLQISDSDSGFEIRVSSFQIRFRDSRFGYSKFRFGFGIRDSVFLILDSDSGFEIRFLLISDSDPGFAES